MDAFAQIATRNISTDRLPLHTPKPPVLPECLLPLTDRRPGPPFRRMERIDDAAGLEALLDRLRTTHAPFLECHAPPPPFIRPNQPIESFDWRLEEPGDAADFNRIMKGEGSWEQITIPHYGGPVGRATTWYRNVFTPTPALLASPRQWIHFEGADYKAQVFLNGNFIGAHEGMFAPFDFDLTDTLYPGENVLVVKVLNECPFMGYEVGGRKQMGDKVYAATGVGWDDPELGWHHCPPGMGIYRKVWLEGRAHCFVDDIFVRPEASLDGAELWIDLFNSGLEEQPLQIELSCFGENFKATVFVDQTMVTQAGPSLNYIRTTFPLPDARIWNLDRPWLYRVRVVVKDAGGRVLDCAERPWGMRHFSQDIENEPKGRFFLNGRSIRLRGANTMGFEQLSVARGNFDLLRDDLLRAKACHMNFLRLTQRPVEREVYDICDRLGLLVQTDLPLFGVVRRNQANECVRQAEEMERFVRNHPSCVVISYINEPFPDALDAPHRHLLRDELEGFFLSADQSVRRQNPDRVIKAVDGDYDPPAPGLPDNHIYNTWYNGHGVELGRFYRGYWLPVKPGWCYGCGEFGAEGLEDLSLMRRLYPPAWLPEKDDDPSWTPANIVFAQSHNFHFCFYDSPGTLPEWIAASQRHQSWATRLQTEVMRRNPSVVTCAIHLFIDAWPAGWMKTIMDCERRPKPAFFAYRDALAPLLLSLRGDRDKLFAGDEARVEVWICDDRPDSPETLLLHYQVEGMEEALPGGAVDGSTEHGGVRFAGFIPLPAPAVNQRTALTVRAQLVDAEGTVRSESDFPYEVFPAVTPASANIVLAGEADGEGPAQRLVRSLGLNIKPLEDAADDAVLLVDSYTDFTARREALLDRVARGARLVFLEASPGRYELPGGPVNVATCGMRGRIFASRQTGHPLIEKFAPDDFKWWYHAGEDCVVPQVPHYFPETEGWQPILTTGQGDWGQSWRRVLVDAEYGYGQGSIVISTLRLADFVDAVPTARSYAERLLGKS